MPRTPAPLSDRFWSKVDKSPGYGPNGDCWIWTGAKGCESFNGGYGLIGMGRRGAGNKQATHVAWLLEHGEWPAGEMCHKCDNPPCVRPDHLFDGTHSENMKDAFDKGRQENPRFHLEDHPRAKLTIKEVADIRSEYFAGGVSQQSLADRHGVNQTLISAIVRNAIWNY